MTSTLVKNQLRAFVLVTVVAMTIVALFYVRIPAQLGFGRYQVDVDLADAGGLYPKAEVTYRGYAVGQVRGLELRDGGGVVAHLDIDDGVKIPVGSIAQVRSTSVIGEQYLNFVPGDQEQTRYLADGATVPVSATRLPISTNQFLDSVNDFLASVPTDDLNTTVDQLGKAFAGDAGNDLGRLIDSSASLTSVAAQNLDPTIRLIDEASPLLSTQKQLEPSIRRYATSLDTLTSQLQASDGDLRSVLRTGGSTVTQFAATAKALDAEAVPLVGDVASFSPVLRDYIPGLRHLLVVLPAAATAQTAAVPADAATAAYPEAGLFFKLTFPTACTTGFPDADKLRDPSEMSTGTLPVDSYCKVPNDSSLVVRGARNSPCPNDPNRRSVTAAGCGLTYDRAGAERAVVTGGPDQTAIVDPQVARLAAPNGPFFLLDPLANAGADTWKEQLEEMVIR